MNARDEFIEHVVKRDVLCAHVTKGDEWARVATQDFLLPSGYSETQYAQFLDLLNFEYDSGYGGQELFGVIWYVDGTWSARGEYDGSEWWEHCVVPAIPANLLGVEP